MKDVKEFVGYARFWVRKLVNLEGFDVSRWKISEDNEASTEFIFDDHWLRTCMRESQNLIQFLYEKFGTDEGNEDFVTAWKYYIVMAKAQKEKLDFAKARKDLKIPELRERNDYPSRYHAPLQIKFVTE